MSSTVTLGGERLGAGKKQKVTLKSYERSTHDLSYVWRSTMSSGTLVPFMSEVALPGDTFDINLNCDVKTHPTVGPLFGSYKVQLDVFQCPVRLYNGKLHMNLLNIGLNMAQIKLPLLDIDADGNKTTDNGQINPSSIFSYFNIRGVGNGAGTVNRVFNAVPYLSYFDIYKNYYANKQEDLGFIIHNEQDINSNSISTCYMSYPEYPGTDGYLSDQAGGAYGSVSFGPQTQWTIVMGNNFEVDPNTILIAFKDTLGYTQYVPLTTIFNSIIWDESNQTFICTIPKSPFTIGTIDLQWWQYDGSIIYPDQNTPKLTSFPLKNIDDMREYILTHTMQSTPFYINSGTIAPYGLPLQQGTSGLYSKESTQEGLLIKTYQSDLFNNWVQTDWIDGTNGINSITAVDTSSGEFTLDTLQLSKKVYDMLNRIAISGGSYDDWLDAVYTHERTRSQENPMYMGGLIKELAFQEVVSNAAAVSGGEEKPLGTLAGRGVLTQKNKGGHVVVRVDEPSYIIGIVSLTPRIDYSQGNKWDVNLKTMDDFHKPALDEIGFQSLISDQLAWWDTTIVNGNPIYKEVGKQPAWINYMTNVNVCRGNFAVQEGDQGIEGGQMYMTLNRRYERDSSSGSIKDLTTYIDPRKYNNIFADGRLDAQNFWTQIAVDITARRKMSARLMPNL